MTIQECYQRLGGDYARTEKRMSSGSLVRRFIVRFPEDGSFSELCAAMEEGARGRAFRAAHTLKGVSGSLGLDRLYASASLLTELLRPEAEAIPEGAHALFEDVTWDYRLTVSAIRAYMESAAP